MSISIWRIMTGIAGALAIVLAWELLAPPSPENFPFPSFSATWASLLALLAEKPVWVAAARTVTSAATGFSIALAAAIPVGLIIGSSQIAFHATHFLVEFLKPIPSIVLLPLVVLVAGPTTTLAVILVAYGCFFPILIQTVAGVHDADPVAKDTGRSFGLSRLSIMRRIVFPSALPFIFTGLRIAITSALIIAVVAELIGGAPGLGHLVFVAQSAGLYSELYAYVLLLGVAGVAVNTLATKTERLLLHWHSSVRIGYT